MEHKRTTITRLTAMAAALLCSAFLFGANSDSGAQLKQLTAKAKEAKTAEQHQAIAGRLVAFAEEMDKEARDQQSAAEEADAAPKAITHKRGVTVDPKFRRQRRARRAMDRAAEAWRMAEYHQRKADEQVEVAGSDGSPVK